MLPALFASQVNQAAPFLEGQVTDEFGRPIAGVSVKIWDCIGTCLGGKTVLTDEKGLYVFERKPFRNWPSLAVSMPGRYEVSRKQMGPELHEEDAETARHVDFVLGTPAAATVRLEGKAPEGWTQSMQIRAGRDVTLHRYDFKSNYDAGWNEWNFELLPRKESLHLVLTRTPVVEESEDPKETEKRRRENWRNQVEIISPAIRLLHPQRYTIRAKVEQDQATETSFITVDSITDAVGENRTEELLVKDPLFGPPVAPDAQKQALALLKRVSDAAVPWNAKPPKSVASYEYDFVDAEKNTTHVQRDQNSSLGPSWSDISRVRGFAWMPPLRWLFSQPENVIFHGVDIGEDRALLCYRLKLRRGFGAGLGIGPSWNGFFTTNFANGTIVIDPKTATVLEHRFSSSLLGEESVETFQDYKAVGEGYAPRSLRIQSGGQDYRLLFKIHKDQLWLLDQATHGDQKDPTVKVENVAVKLESE